MIYAAQISKNYHKNKDRINKNRKDCEFSSVLTLEDALHDSYKEYRKFCIKTGVMPKKII